MIKNMKDYFNEESSKHDEFFLDELGLKEFYDEIEKVLDKYPNSKEILVLGCGSGLEIERIKNKCNVTGIDISDKMLEVLNNKKLNSNINLTTICASFLDINFDEKKYDIVLSCYAMHHFNEEQKLNLYKKIYNCLNPNGVFINGDSFSKTKLEEEEKLEKANKIYKDNNLEFASLHIDVHFTYNHELEVLEKVGFKDIDLIKEWTMSKIYVCTKK